MAAVERSISQAHPIPAIFLGIAMLVAAVAWLMWAETYSSWIMRTFFAWVPWRKAGERVASQRWYRVLTIYFGAAFLAIGGAATIIAGIVNLRG